MNPYCKAEPDTRLTPVVPLPREPESGKSEERRLWIGNLDPRITEYRLLKLLQKFGAIEKFDLLFHKSGAQAGQPRGYAFVTYADGSDARSMMDAVDSSRIGSKRVAVRWAHTVAKTEMEKGKPEVKIPALVGGAEESKVSRSAQIRAIESKLRTMAGDEEIVFSETPSTSSSSSAPAVAPHRQHQQHRRNAHAHTHTHASRPSRPRNRSHPYAK